MNAAVYTLIAVALTGAFAIAKDLLVEGRRDQAERDRLRDRELRAARVACLLVADELDTLAENFELLARLGRTLGRPIEESPFLATDEWHSQKPDLASVIDQLDTWKGLGSLYHNADSMRRRIIIDGPNVSFPAERVATIRENAESARELREIVYGAIAEIDKGLAS